MSQVVGLVLQDVSPGRKPGKEALWRAPWRGPGSWYRPDHGVGRMGIPDLSIDVTTENNILLLHGRLRAQKRDGRVRPYLDGLVGVRPCGGHDGRPSTPTGAVIFVFVTTPVH